MPILKIIKKSKSQSLPKSVVLKDSNHTTKASLMSDTPTTHTTLPSSCPTTSPTHQSPPQSQSPAYDSVANVTPPTTQILADTSQRLTELLHTPNTTNSHPLQGPPIDLPPTPSPQLLPHLSNAMDSSEGIELNLFGSTTGYHGDFSSPSVTTTTTSTTYGGPSFDQKGLFGGSYRSPSPTTHCKQPDT